MDKPEDNLPPSSGGILETIDAGVRAAANFLTFGYADKLAAKADEKFSGGTYQENLERERAMTARNEKEHSAAVATGQVGAVAIAVVPTLVKGGLVWAGTQTVSLGQKVMTLMASAETVALGKAIISVAKSGTAASVAGETVATTAAGTTAAAGVGAGATTAAAGGTAATAATTTAVATAGAAGGTTLAAVETTASVGGQASSLASRVAARIAETTEKVGAKVNHVMTAPARAVETAANSARATVVSGGINAGIRAAETGAEVTGARIAFETAKLAGKGAAVTAFDASVATVGMAAKGVGYLVVPTAVSAGVIKLADTVVGTDPPEAGDGSSAASVDHQANERSAVAVAASVVTVAAIHRFGPLARLAQTSLGGMTTSGLAMTSYLGRANVAGEGVGSSYVEDKVSGDPSLMTRVASTVQSTWLDVNKQLVTGEIGGKYGPVISQFANLAIDTELPAAGNLSRKEQAVLRSDKADFANPAMRQMAYEQYSLDFMTSQQELQQSLSSDIIRQRAGLITEDERLKLREESQTESREQFDRRWAGVVRRVTAAEEQVARQGEPAGTPVSPAGGAVVPVSAQIPAEQGVDMGALQNAGTALQGNGPVRPEPPKAAPQSQKPGIT